MWMRILIEILFLKNGRNIRPPTLENSLILYVVIFRIEIFLRVKKTKWKKDKPHLRQRTLGSTCCTIQICTAIPMRVVSFNISLIFFSSLLYTHIQGTCLVIYSRPLYFSLSVFLFFLYLSVSWSGLNLPCLFILSATSDSPRSLIKYKQFHTTNPSRLHTQTLTWNSKRKHGMRPRGIYVSIYLRSRF